MNLPLLRKIFDDARWLLLACVAVIFAFSWIRVLIVASIQLYQFQRIARNLPELVQRLSPVPLERLVSYPGLIGFTYEEPIVYLIMAVWTVSRGSDSVSGEISRGTMELLLAQPIGRVRYLMIHTFVTVVGIIILAVAAHVGTRVGVETARIKVPAPTRQFTVPFLGTKVDLPSQEKQVRYIPISRYVEDAPFWVAAANYGCFGAFLLGITTAMSSWDRYRWRTIGAIVAFYVLETIIELTGMAVDGCQWMLNCTFFSAYEPVEFVTKASADRTVIWRFWDTESYGILPDLGPMGCNAILLGWGLTGIAIAILVFKRRDIPAPL